MSKKIILLVFYVLFLLPASSYAQWERVGPISYTSITTIAQSKFAVSTDAGTIYTTTDAGGTWESKIINLNRNFSSIDFYDEKKGIVGADSGNVVVTTDRGKTWTEATLETTNRIVGVSWISEDTIVCITSDASWISVNKGILWKKIEIQGLTSPKAMHTDKNHICIIVCSDGKVVVSTDGAKNWSLKQLPTSSDILSVCILNEEIVVGTNTAGIFQSQDNGNTWSNTFKNGTDSGSIYNVISSVAFLSDTTIVAFQQQSSKYLQSNDLGATWNFFNIKQDSSENVQIMSDILFNSISSDKQGNVLLCGSYGTIYQIKKEYSHSKFIHHCSMGVGIAGHISETVYMAPSSNSSRHINALCDKGPFGFSTDAGISWLSRYVINTGGHSSARYFGFHFPDKNNGVLFSQTGKFQYFFPFVKTSDNGKTWDKDVVNSPRGNFMMSNVDSHENIYIIEDSTVYISKDKGTHWNFLSDFFIDEGIHPNKKQLWCAMNAVQAVDDSVIIVSTVISDSIYSGKDINSIYISHSALGISTDFGHTWKTQYLVDSTMTIYGFYFLSSQVGFVNVGVPTTKSVYLERKVLKTLDGGKSWLEVPGIYSNFTLGDISFSNDKRIGVVAGDIGLIHISTDSGNTWNVESVKYLNSINQRVGLLHPYFIDDSTVLITSLVGFWRKVIHTSAISDVQSVVTSNQYLQIQLHPTPVQNGDLHCTVYGLYSVERKNEISIAVYDILGRNIADLSSIARANSNGYSTSFDVRTTNFTPGVYSIILQTSNGCVANKFIVAH